VLENELLSSGSLEVSVSIPYRQWYDALELTPDEADFEKDQLESVVTQSVVPTGPMTRGTVCSSCRAGGTLLRGCGWRRGDRQLEDVRSEQCLHVQP
ncbi:hypothetical protein FOZ62_020756, partial [Perkinsus olseni]